MIKSLLAVAMIGIAGNIYAAERVIEFPLTLEGHIECENLQKDLREQFPYSNSTIVGSTFLTKIKDSNKYFEANCLLPEQINFALKMNRLDPKRYPLKTLYVAIYDPKEFPQMRKAYEERQQAQRDADEVQRKARLQQYGL